MVVASLVGVAVFGLLWEVFVRVADVAEFILLPPSKIIAELADNPRVYFDAALVTGRHALVGIALALGISIVAGAILASSRFIEQASQPVLVLILVAPWVAYFTSIVAWLGHVAILLCCSSSRSSLSRRSRSPPWPGCGPAIRRPGSCSPP